MKISAVSAIAMLGVMLCGCATVFDGTTQKIAVTTPQVRGAKCVLSIGRGRVTIVTPGYVKVKSSSQDIPVRCTKEGYVDADATIPAGFASWGFANVLNAGLGFGVDAVTGSINEYPDTVRIKMQPDDGSSPMATVPDSDSPEDSGY